MAYGEDYRTQLRGQPRHWAKNSPAPHSLLERRRSEWTRKGRSNICNLRMTFRKPIPVSGSWLQTEPTTAATIGKIAAPGKPNSAGYELRMRHVALALRYGDPLGNQLLQPPQMAVVNATLFRFFTVL